MPTVPNTIEDAANTLNDAQELIYCIENHPDTDADWCASLREVYRGAIIQHAARILADVEKSLRDCDEELKSTGAIN